MADDQHRKSNYVISILLYCSICRIEIDVSKLTEASLNMSINGCSSVFFPILRFSFYFDRSFIVVSSVTTVEY